MWKTPYKQRKKLPTSTGDGRISEPSTVCGAHSPVYHQTSHPQQTLLDFQTASYLDELIIVV